MQQKLMGDFRSIAHVENVLNPTTVQRTVFHLPAIVHRHTEAAIVKSKMLTCLSGGIQNPS
jgi:hypothetical protein